MLAFNIENKPRFASDPETGEVFGFTEAEMVEALSGIYIVNGHEYRTIIFVEWATERLRVPGPLRQLKIECSSIQFGAERSAGC